MGCLYNTLDFSTAGSVSLSSVGALINRCSTKSLSFSVTGSTAISSFSSLGALAISCSFNSFFF